MSRQRAWQLRQIAAGRCARCARKRRQYKTLCDPCRGEANADQRQYRQRRKLRGWLVD